MEITNEKLSELAFQMEQQFMMQNIEKFVSEYERIEDIEIMALCACWLNVGMRAEGVEYARWAYNRFKDVGSPLEYVLNKSQYCAKYQYFYTKFTTQHTLHDWWALMGKLNKIYASGSTILAEVKARIDETLDPRDAILKALLQLFDGVKQMPTDGDYIPNKFVRFVMMMVRPKPMHTGIWTETEPEMFDATKTYIPLNSELVKTISDNEILPEPTMTWDFAKTLSEYFAEVFPEDPARGYFSLLGLQCGLHLINRE